MHWQIQFASAVVEVKPVSKKSGLPIRRRRFFQETALATAALAAGSAHAKEITNLFGAEHPKPATQIALEESNQVRFTLREADGAPLSPERAATLTARDLPNDPMPQDIVLAEGRARIALAKEPLQFFVRLQVPGFGEVYCYAANADRGYTSPQNLDFVVEAARTRLHRVNEAADAAKRAGIPGDTEFNQLISAARKPIPETPGPARTAAAYASLANSLRAGERLTLNAARHRISRLASPRKEFLFGALSAGWERGGNYEQLFLKAFNSTVLNWYAWSQHADPVALRIDYTKQDRSFDWAHKRGLIAKGFGYVYLLNGATPPWLRAWTFEQVIAEYRRVVEQTTRRSNGRWRYVEVINEAHDKANIFKFSHEQIIQLTKEACIAARSGSPDVKRVINHCCLWAEYGRRKGPKNQRLWSPYRYLRDCLANGVEFEVIGLQLYYPQQDLFEIDRMLQRFTALNRKVHISELACNSAPGLDPASLRPKSLVPGWHGPWTETMQADWVEAIYTLCYSRPEFEAVSWWDVADGGGHFWPNGGLLHKDFTPKQSFHRLLELKQRWGLAG